MLREFDASVGEEDAESAVTEGIEPDEDPLLTSPFMGRGVYANGISLY